MPKSRVGTKIAATAAAMLLVLCCLGLRASSPAAVPQGLRAYALAVVRMPLHSWSGFGVYLGGGRILTAEHVVGDPKRSPVYIDIGGVTLPASLLKRGRFADLDLAELGIDPDKVPIEIRSLPPLTICPADPLAGTAVVVATPSETAPSRVISPDILPPWLFPAALTAQFPTLIKDVYSTGNSGSGVFDAASGCLLGIVSRKIEVTETRLVAGLPVRHVEPLAKYFVGPGLIRRFLGP